MSRSHTSNPRARNLLDAKPSFFILFTLKSGCKSYVDLPLKGFGHGTPRYQVLPQTLLWQDGAENGENLNNYDDQKKTSQYYLCSKGMGYFSQSSSYKEDLSLPSYPAPAVFINILPRSGKKIWFWFIVL